MMNDLIIIGGGPAGTSAAITAARAGLKVILLEAGELPRHRVCGEFVSPESLCLLDSYLDADSALLRDAPRIQHSRVFLDDQVLNFRLHPAALSITRFDLDHALWLAAVAAGAQARTRMPVQEVIGRGPFTVRTAHGDLVSPAVIAACGRWSRLEQFRPTVPPGPRWIGLKAHFEEASLQECTDLYFFDRGYCGVQPIGNGRVNACAMVRSDVATSLDQVLASNATLRERSRSWQQVFETVSTSPLVFRDPTPVREGVLLAGDAAGFIDPFAGDGISLALRTGALAVDSLLPFFHANRAYADVTSDYARAYRKLIAPVFRAAARVRAALRLPRAIRSRALGLMRLPAVARLVVRSTRGRNAA
jgi:menaquinone-9 beta-reductase